MPTDCHRQINMNYLNPPTEVYEKKVSSDEKLPSTNILIVGASQVGKTALAVRYLTKRYIGEYYNSSDCRYKTSVSLTSTHDHQIELLDPGDIVHDTEERKEKRIKWADGFILVFSVTDKQSFDEVVLLHNQIKNMKNNNDIPFILIGNKIDLVHNRQVGCDDILDFIEFVNCTYYELSASVMALGYVRLCEAIQEISELTLSELNKKKIRSKSWSVDKRRGSFSLGDQRRRSLSPRPIRNAISKMFGKTNQREDREHSITDLYERKYKNRNLLS